MTTVQLLGCDGSTWPLLGLGASPVKLAGGIGGLHLPKVSHIWTTTARRSGSTWRGSRMATRQFSVSLYFADSASMAQFFPALSTDLTSRLVVNGTRTLTVRLDEDNEYAFTKDPTLGVDRILPVNLVADRPEWAGAPQSATFPYSAASGSNFFGGGSGTKGPPFYISAASALTTASVSNPGDLPAYPVWTITGPVTTATVGVVGQTVTLPFPLRTGDAVIIDTEAQTITDPQGTNLWPQMGGADPEFAPIPAGDRVPVVVGMAGGATGASIKVELTPLYRRAW